MTIHPLRYGPQPEDHPDPIISFVGEQARGSETTPHSHDRAQLFHIQRGSVTVQTQEGSFVVPPERAIWLPPGVVHCSTYHTATDIRFLYIRTEDFGSLPGRTSVVHVTPLLRELISAFMASAPDYAKGSATARLAHVLVDQIAGSRAVPLHLPLPQTERLRAAVAPLAEDPAREVAVEELAARAHLSLRSFERHFSRETGLTFRAWRRQAKLMKAVEWLSQGTAVGEISDRLGYEGPSAFVATFKKAFGVTPGRYFAG
ncbi:AraC family transcriptional regulator [Stappia indica]|uniref:AraC family transcriptional regulator n=1 Tax=Stappia indica TaxID=538381 RepID=UPI001CD67C9A|nr:helix-turn-helix transcriptional regulator [Stappia indica]MCA1298858.1 helix-turn-helix transcriptional regulator [Stappia indica]